MNSNVNNHKIGLYRAISCLLLIAIFLSLIKVNVYATDIPKWDGTTAKKFASGKGTKKSPYNIANGEQLALLARMTNAGKTYKGVYFKLTNNIDLSEMEWTPIGNQANPFMGNFDGNNKLIMNLHIEKGTDYLGLFGYVKNGKLSNIVIMDVFINIDTSSKTILDKTGGICGYLSGGEVTNSYINGGSITSSRVVGGIIGECKDSVIKECDNLTEINSCYAAGGIVGSATNTEIYDCVNSSVVQSLKSYYGDYNSLGGIVGCGSNVSIKNCCNKGIIISDFNTGGIIGTIKGGNITGCINTSEIYARYNQCGGIVGSIQGEYISDCYNTGEIYGITEIGGIAGYATGYYKDKTKKKTDLIIKNCYNEGTLTTKLVSGGIVGEINEGIIDSCANFGSINIGDYKILNTYKKEYHGGIAGKSYNLISNCVNTGYVEGSGITASATNLKNCYNIGKTTIAGVTQFNNGTVTNCYYDIETALSGIESGNQGSALPEMIDSMKTSKFAKKLNGKNSDVWIYDTKTNGGYPIPRGLISEAIRPIRLYIVNSFNSEVVMAWEPIDGVAYQIYRYNEKTKKYDRLKTIKDSNVNFYVDSDVSIGTTYKYKVRAYKEFAGNKYYSDFTAIKSAKVLK